jgi:hypothetical protein
VLCKHFILYESIVEFENGLVFIVFGAFLGEAAHGLYQDTIFDCILL